MLDNGILVDQDIEVVKCLSTLAINELDSRVRVAGTFQSAGHIKS